MIDQVAPEAAEQPPPPSPSDRWFDVRVEQDAQTFRIVLAGEIDIAVQRRLQQVCDDAGRAGLPTQVDARAVTFMDSTGIAFLARLSTRCPGTLGLDASPVVRWLVDVTGIGELVDLADDAGSSRALP